MAATLPFLTSYDPPGTSEGSLDPLGLYQIADQLASQLVPAVRERMQRVRFLTAMAVGALVCEGLDDDRTQRDASPYLVWEWLVVEALIRQAGKIGGIWGIPGTLVARRALEQRDYLDARNYLKTPRIFGFHGVYKRLAVHLGVLNVHLQPGPNAEALVDGWARDRGLAGIDDFRRSDLRTWSRAVVRSFAERPPRTRTGWSNGEWESLASAFAPGGCRGRERRWLREALNTADERRLGALPILWQLQPEFDDLEDEDYVEELLHDRLEQREPSYRPLLDAIRAYESFARHLQDAFDVLRHRASGQDARGFVIPDIAADDDFKACIKGLDKRYERAYQALAAVVVTNASLPALFQDRFWAFGEPPDDRQVAVLLCKHHETIQKAKSADGKRPWFDRIGQDRIYIRHSYRLDDHSPALDRYLHDYRGNPIRRFYKDLS